MHQSLKALQLDEFVVQVGFASTPSALRRILQENATVKQVSAALSSQVLSENDIRLFADKLMDDFKPSTRFPHEIIIAALAVALEKRGTDYADEFIADLANLQITEMSMATRVGRQCEEFRRENVTKTIRTETNGDVEAFELSQIPYEELEKLYPRMQGTARQKLELTA